MSTESALGSTEVFRRRKTGARVAAATCAAVLCFAAAVSADQTGSPEMNPSAIAEPRPSASAGAHRQVPDVARHLWHDLMCLCGECDHKTLEGCECGYAAERRDEILDAVIRHGFGTPEKDDATYALVAREYVERHKHDGDNVRGRIGLVADLLSRPIVALGGALASFGLLFAAAELWRRKRAEKQATEKQVHGAWKSRRARGKR